ncbi:MAG: ABC transporter ATP-binding protein, partial [Clostridiales bacterium]
MKQIISLEGITKKYNNKIVLDNINLSFYDNQSTAIIGANGTGKSTLLKIIAGLLPVDKGKRISHLSRNININYVPERFPKLRMNPREYLFYMGSIQEIEKSNLKKRIEAYLEIFHISENMRKTWINQLSKGSIQKIAVIQALLKTPDVLILDEPISGQDIKSQDVFIRLMKRFKSENVVIIFSCHEEYLIDKLADRVLTIDNNRIKSDVLTNINENINDSGVLDYNLSNNKQIWQNRYY